LFNLVYKDTKHKVIIQTIDQLFAILIVRRLRSAQKTTHRYCFARE